MGASNITLPNPYTPMAFVPPELERKALGLVYAAVGSVAVLLWDIILHLPQDYKLATQYRINISFIIYCIARVASLAYVFGVVISLTAPVGNCDLFRQISILSPFTTPLSTLLFVMRVCALYRNNKYVVAFFTMTWLFVLSASIVVPTGTSGRRIGNTKYCFDSRTRIADALLSSSVFIHDSFIFVAVSWAFMRISYSDLNVKNSVQVMVFGRHLPAFARSILRDGQAYYLAVLALNLFFTVLCYMPHQPLFPCTIGIPFFVVLNTMSSYVYRNVRFGFYQDYTISRCPVMNDRPVQRPDQSGQHHGIAFDNGISARTFEGKAGLEAGDDSNGEEGTGARKSKGDLTGV